jgi:hypothetical protein
MPNSKISELKETTVLHSDYTVNPFPHQASLVPPGSGDNDAFFMIARPNIRNENISYTHLKSSILDKNLLLTGKQLISGEKTFSDPCNFLSRTNVNEVLDNTFTGDISGNIFVGNSGLFQNMGVGKAFHERLREPSYRLDISGDSLFLGDLTHTGYHRQFGSLYRIGDSNLLGDFRITGDSWRHGDMRMEGDYDLTGDLDRFGNVDLYGDKLLIGDVTHTGNHRQFGELYRIGDSSLLGDFRITGDSWRYGDMRMKGDYYLTGDRTQLGHSLIKGDKKIAGDLHVGEYIYHIQDSDTFVRLEDDKVSLEAGSGCKLSLNESNEDEILFFTSGEEQARLTNEGFLAINTQDPIAELSVTGDSFLENVFVYDDFSKKFNKVFGGDDEKVTFKTVIDGGKDKYHIDLPKTFKEKPILSVSLENCNGNILVPFILQSGNRHEFYMQFSNVLPPEEYIINTTAICSSIMQNKNGLNYDQFPYCSPMDPGANRHGMQRFYFQPNENSSTQEIFFPLGYDEPPNISINIEGGEYVVPYIISNITNESFVLKLGSTLTKDHTIHCCSSTQGIHRLGEKVNYHAQWFEDLGDRLIFRNFQPGDSYYRPEFSTSLPSLQLWELNTENNTIKPRCEPNQSTPNTEHFFHRTGEYLTIA